MTFRCLVLDLPLTPLQAFEASMFELVDVWSDQPEEGWYVEFIQVSRERNHTQLWLEPQFEVIRAIMLDDSP